MRIQQAVPRYTGYQSPQIRFARMARQLPKNLDTTTYDVVIVGGRINGAAIARDLALRGASVLVLDKSDPMNTTGKASRLGHGGLRYLPHGEFNLVMESRREVANMLENAKHLIRPLSFILPIYKHSEHPGWQIKLGLMFYDFFVGKGLMPKHKRLSSQEMQEAVPGLSTQGLVDGFQYYDTQMTYPERMCIEMLRDATAQGKESRPVYNLGHANVTHIDELPNGGVNVTFEDTINHQTHQIRGKYLINAAGPWVDKLIAATDSPRDLKAPQMGPTKGTHVLVKNTIGLKHAVYSEAQDKRPYFIIPFPLNQTGQATEHLLIGTTDDKPPWKSEFPTAEEVNYLIQSSNDRIPSLNLKDEDIFAAYAGFRPLPKSDKNAGAVTRKHLIKNKRGSHIFHIIGGKLTTHRSLAEEVGNKLAKLLNISRHTPTAHRPLPGANHIDNLAAFKAKEVPQAAQRYGVSQPVVDELINRYGSLYTEVLDLTLADPTLKAPLTQSAPLIKAQVLHAIRYEQAETLMDIMTESLKTDLLPGAAMDGLDAAAQILAQEKALTPNEMQAEKAAYCDYINQTMQWKQPN